ncbi:HD-GYP domain-containing protein [Paenibacillus hemerocallicola]|uniref:HD-GYP domain-containing protein n=1 Tax=Paenibacillus hemerocallicola TaxID=1172614 RepID=A0A5C4T896_9BACL|nr:HD-GYP domain-containing protein [Paenibacillus hemerocallicola]
MVISFSASCRSYGTCPHGGKRRARVGNQGKTLYEHLMGKRLIRDLFNSKGVLLIAAATVLDAGHADILEDNGMILTVRDVEEVGHDGRMSVVLLNRNLDEAIAVVKGLFDHIRITRQIPLAEIRTRVIPVIRQSAERLHLFQLFTMLQVKHDYIYRHSVAVGAVSMLLGKWLRLSEAELLQLTTAAVLHDIGKTQIPLELLNKPERLSDDEFDTMKRHTLIGFEMIRKTVGTTQRQASVALQHHERIDGSGYPFGLRDDKIDLFSRIVAVADVFHAMTSKTVYRDPSPMYEVLKQLESGAYGMFDPVVVTLLIQKFMQALIGYEVMLTDGTRAKIVLIHPHHQTRPLVQAGDRFIDLSKEYSVHIERVFPSDDGEQAR